MLKWSSGKSRVRLLDLTRNSCEKCHYRSPAHMQESNLRTCDSFVRDANKTFNLIDIVCINYAFIICPRQSLVLWWRTAVKKKLEHAKNWKSVLSHAVGSRALQPFYVKCGNAYLNHISKSFENCSLLIFTRVYVPLHSREAYMRKN
jgi:hypothetical protein